MKKLWLASLILSAPTHALFSEEVETRALIANEGIEGTDQELEELYDEIIENTVPENHEVAEAGAATNPG